MLAYFHETRSIGGKQTASTSTVGRACRAGEAVENGYLLWLYSDILVGEGMTFDELNTSEEEVARFLVIELRNWLQQARDELVPRSSVYLKLLIMRAYFLGGFGEPINVSMFNDLSITPDEFSRIEKIGN